MLNEVVMKRVYVRGVVVGEICSDEFESIRNRVNSDKAVIARQLAIYLNSFMFTSFDFLIYTSAIWSWTIGVIAFGLNDWSEWILNIEEVETVVKTSFAWSLLLGFAAMCVRICMFGLKGYMNVIEHEISEVVKKSIGCSSPDMAITTF